MTVNGEEIQVLHTGKAEIKGKEIILPYHNYFYAMEKVTTNFYKVKPNILTEHINSSKRIDIINHINRTH